MSATEPDWNLYRSFLAVLREGSLSSAARDLNLTQPTLARHIATLEEILGSTLFLRSSQGLTPTEASLELQPYAESIEINAASLLRIASGLGGVVKGTVRISASEMFGSEVLPAILAGLRRRHKALELELVLSNAVQNLIRRDADIAVRNVAPAQEALVAKKLGTVTLGLYAHRDYLAHAGLPQRLADLAGHSVIGFDRLTPALRAMLRQLPEWERVRFALRVDNDVAQWRAIRAGFGIGVCQVALGDAENDLVRLFADDLAVRLPVWLAMHENLRTTPRCRAVFDGLAEGLASHMDR